MSEINPAKDYHEQTGEVVLNGDDEYDIDYVAWLEKHYIKHAAEVARLTAECDALKEKCDACGNCDEDKIRWRGGK